jgi:hypothetical protein
MKKPVIIIAAVSGVLALAVAGAVVWDMTSRDKKSSTEKVVFDPLAQPPAQIANLQAPPPQAGNAEVTRLIAQLGDDSWDKRHEATEALKKIGKPAAPQLEAAVNHRNIEISTRAKAILRHINGGAAEAAAQPNAGGNAAGAAGAMDLGALMNNPQMQQMMQNPQMMEMARQMMAGQGGQGGAGGMDMGAVMQNPQVQQMIQQMMAGQGGGARGGAGGMDLGALMNNPQVQQMLQNPQFMQMVMQMMAGQGGQGGRGGNRGGMLGGAQGGRGGQLGGGQLGGGNLAALMQNPQIQQLIQQMMAGGGRLGGGGGGLARNAPAPPPAAEMSTDLTSTFGVRVGEANGGVRVVDVKANTPAANAGLRTGDLIVSVNGRAVQSGEDFKDALAASAATIKLDVQRRGDVITLSAKK